MRRFLGWVAFLAGSWMLISPQALIGLKELNWMHNYTFRGEVLLGIVVMAMAYYLLDLKPVRKAEKRSD
jgi:hypothetical protein